MSSHLERMSVGNNFQKCITALKTTECSQKEKIQYFNNLGDSLTQNAFLLANYSQYPSQAIQILLFFCEDASDSSIRMSAFENLIKVVRICEAGNINKVQIDLYHEIKKNGNERSLRVCLNLFGNYCHLIKQRKVRAYAQNLLPCMMAISQRRETLLLETLTDFVKKFAEYFLINVTETELKRLVDCFLAQLSVSCPTKRRCMAQNVLTVVENHRKASDLAVYCLTKTIDILIQFRDHVDGTCGILGFWRILMPVALEIQEDNLQVQNQVLEIFDLCLQYVTCPNHTLINASLEVLNVLTTNINDKISWISRLNSNQNDLFAKRNSLKLRICSNHNPDKEPTGYEASENITLEMIEAEDLELEQIKNIESISMISQKSSDSSFGGFLNTLISSSESVTKIFKAEKGSPKIGPVSEREEDDLSLQSLEELSLGSLGHDSRTTTPVIQIPEEKVEEPQLDDVRLNLKTPVLDPTSRQSLLLSTIRTLASKFLLSGEKKGLISDLDIRISIKHLSLVVFGNILQLAPDYFGKPLKSTSDFRTLDIQIREFEQVEERPTNGSNVDGFTNKALEEELLEIKDDHFGPSSSNLDFLSPLSKSVDENLLKESTSPKMTRMIHSEIIVRDKDMEFNEIELENNQFLYEVLLFHDHSDPILRADVITLIENVVKGVNRKNQDYEDYLQDFMEDKNANQYLKLEKLIEIVRKGLSDENHGVAKASLNCIEIVLPYLMRHSTLLIGKSSFNDTNSCDLFECIDFPDKISLAHLLEEILSVQVIHKYWLIKCKLVETLAELEYDLVFENLGSERGIEFKEKCFRLMFVLLQDEDNRIRTASAKSLCKFINQNPKKELDDCGDILNDFVAEKIFKSLPDPLNRLNLRRKKVVSMSDDGIKLLFTLSNNLLEIDNKNQLLGTISCLKIFVDNYHPITFYQVWEEFKILDIFGDYLKENAHILFDIVNHADALEIYNHLLAGKMANSNADCKELQNIFDHALKLINIYCLVFTNQIPLQGNQVQKPDFLINDKALNMLHKVGYFGNSVSFMKLYKVIKNIHETYKIDTNPDVEQKMLNLLRVSLKTLCLCLEFKPMNFSISQTTKLIEEILGYCSILVNFEQNLSIQCTRHLFRFFFEQNFHSQRNSYEYFYKSQTIEERDFVKKVAEFNQMNQGQFYHEEIGLLKLFETMVINSLKLFMRSNSRLQSTILDLLCQLLQVKVNYTLLDSNHVFLNFILKQLEFMEVGQIRQADLCIENIIRFLFLVNNKKLVSVPKLINIVDTLLANNGIANCSVKALTQLSFEIFFNRSLEPNNEDESSMSPKTIVELTTEKEFIFSILMKFVQHKSVQKMVYIIIINEVDNRQAYESELVQSLLNIIDKFEDHNSILDVEYLKNVFSLLSSDVLKEYHPKFMSSIQKIQESKLSTKKLKLMKLLIEEIILNKNIDIPIENDVIIQILTKSIQDSKRDDMKREVSYMMEILFSKNITNSLITDLFSNRSIIDFLFEIRFLNSEVFINICKNSLKQDCFLINQIYGNLNNNNETDQIAKQVLFDELSKNNCKNGDVLNQDVKTILSKDISFLINNINNFSINVQDYDFILNELDHFLNKSKTRTLEEETKLLFVIKLISKVTAFLPQVLRILIEHFVENQYPSVKNQSRDLFVSILRELVEMESISASVLSKEELLNEFDRCQKLKWWPNYAKIIDETYERSSTEITLVNDVDESWFVNKILTYLKSQKYSKCAIELILDMKSESKIQVIVMGDDFKNEQINEALTVSFEFIKRSFRKDCAFNKPHINYLKIPTLLKLSKKKFIESLYDLILTLKPVLNIEESLSDANTYQIISFIDVTVNFLENYKALEVVVLRYVELKVWDRFNQEHLLDSKLIDLLIKFCGIISTFLQTPTVLFDNLNLIEKCSYCVKLIIEQPPVFNKWNNCLTRNEFDEDFRGLIQSTTVICKRLLDNVHTKKFQYPDKLINKKESNSIYVELLQDAIFLSYFNEKVTLNGMKYNQLWVISKEISLTILRFNCFYSMACIPFNLLLSLQSNVVVHDLSISPIPMISIDQLKDPEMLKLYVTKVNCLGIVTRQHFEENLMSLLVLVNSEFNYDEIDEEEEFQIKALTLSAITGLLISAKEFPRMSVASGRFHHSSRNEELPAYGIHLKKLNNILQRISYPNPSQEPNLERISAHESNSSLQTRHFKSNQYNLTTMWQSVEDLIWESTSQIEPNICLKNWEYNLSVTEIDYKSSVKMVFEMYLQLYETGCEKLMPILLPNLVRLVEILVSKEQIKWLKEKVFQLHESIPIENSIYHSYIVFLMCKTSAILVPSFSEVEHLCQTVLPMYAKSSCYFIHNAMLRGAFALFESCIDSNTTIAGLSEEIQLLKRFIVNYVNRNGIIETSKFKDCHEHSRLVWALTFYVIEKTIKYNSDCPLLASTIVFANNFVKNTTDVETYTIVLNGLQRIVTINSSSNLSREKIERIALDLLKVNNEEFSIHALQLLMSCLYIGSIEQLELTEKSNGIVQDDPEIMIQFSEKVDILFNRIKTSTKRMAFIYGDVLSLMTRDLLPPNEILTKVIKELIVSTQPHIEVIAKILFQVFRSAIDAAHLTLLQDWLVCSLQNFTSLPIQKAMWCLTVIFISSSLNVTLVKMFPILLCSSMKSNQKNDPLSEKDQNERLSLLIVTAKDFYDRLTPQLKQRFKESFISHGDPIFINVLNALK